MNDYGMKVIFKKFYFYKPPVETHFRNVTEVHFNYKQKEYPDGSKTTFTAIESDIHGTGMAFEQHPLDEFIIVPEIELAENF